MVVTSPYHGTCHLIFRYTERLFLYHWEKTIVQLLYGNSLILTKQILLSKRTQDAVVCLENETLQCFEGHEVMVKPNKKLRQRIEDDFMGITYDN